MKQARSLPFLAASVAFTAACGASPVQVSALATGVRTASAPSSTNSAQLRRDAATLDREGRGRMPATFAGAYVQQRHVTVAFTQDPEPSARALARTSGVDPTHVHSTLAAVSLLDLESLASRLAKPRGANFSIGSIGVSRETNSVELIVPNAADQAAIAADYPREPLTFRIAVQGDLQDLRTPPAVRK